MVRHPREALEQPAEMVHAEWVESARADQESRVITVAAGLGSGKTHGACQWHHDRCIVNEAFPQSAFMAPIYHKIHDSAIPTYRKILQAEGLVEGLDYRVVKSPFPKLIYTYSGHEVHFISAERPERIVAVEYSHATTTEANSTKAEARRELRGRVGRTKAVKVGQSLWEGVPQGINDIAEKHDGEKVEGFVEVAKREYVKQFTVDGRPMQYRHFRLTSYDNPFLNEDYIQGLFDAYGHLPAYIASWIWGHFVPLVTGNCYSEYNPGLHDKENIEPDPCLPIDWTFDFNAEPLAWCAIQQVPSEEYTTQGRIERVSRDIVIHEGDLGATLLDDAAVEFAAKHHPARFANTPITIYGDSTGHHSSHKAPNSDYKRLAKYLRDLGFRNVSIAAMTSNPLETLSVQAVNDLFRENKLLICKRCKALKSSLITTKWKQGIRKIDKPSGERHTHPGDALKYWAFTKHNRGVRPRGGL
jgi:hypothetical protein